jgi:hypothetical protein
MNVDALPWELRKKIAAWQRGRPVPGMALGVARFDEFGFIIRWDEHGKQTAYGWEVDHVRALALGGTDSLDNVRALHWQMNRKLGGHVGNALKGLYSLGQPKPSVQNIFAGGLFGSSRR